MGQELTDKEYIIDLNDDLDRVTVNITEQKKTEKKLNGANVI